MITRVLDVRELTPTAYVLRVERAGLEFEPGQCVSLGRPGSLSTREYTVYSTPPEPYLEVLIKVVPGGLVSHTLRALEPGEPVEMDGPFGRFLVPPALRSEAELLFVATGTGVSPFHCFALSYPGLRYRLVHGVRMLEDRYDHQTFSPERYVSCVSGEPGGDHRGRVTSWLAEHRVAPQTYCYLCGNSDMIYEAVALLREQGVPRERMSAEVYF